MASAHYFFLPVQLPFDWEALLAFLRVRATPGVEMVTDSAYERTFGDGAEPQTLRVTYDRRGAGLKVETSRALKSAQADEVGARIQQIFKPAVDTRPIEESLASSRQLSTFVRAQPGLRVPGGWCAFEIATRAVLGQQISVPAATTLMGRLVRLAGTRLNENEWLFPTAEHVLHADLSKLGVPGQRRETLKGLAAFFADHGDRCVLQSSTREKLLSIKGIGRWTAGYILMRSSQDHDHWPEGDLVLRKALSDSKAQMDVATLEQTFKQWTPYRSYATIHLWRGYGGSKNSNTKHDE